MTKKHLIVIVGPTAIGKTALSIALAQHFNTEIFSADSRQFFREMTIGTAKPSADELKSVPHHFINSHGITDPINVGTFEKIAVSAINKAFETHNVLVLAGGSGLYIDAVCKGFDELPEADSTVRETLNALYQTNGISGLQQLLAEKDPEYFSVMDTANPQRLMRALEVCLVTNNTYTYYRKGQAKHRTFNCIKIGLATERAILYDQINKRVDAMIQNGLVNEVRSLIPYKHLNALQTVGYKELFDYFDNKTELATAVELIKQNTRRFAKRQLTWFRRDTSINWFEPSQVNEVISFLEHQLR
jgi:tRNA dimethylallyltransferase